MIRFETVFASVVTCLVVGCGGHGDGSVGPEPSVRLGILGQALIEHDPRDYLDM